MSATEKFADSLTVRGAKWTYELTHDEVSVRDASGETTSVPRWQFHGFQTITPQDVKKFIMNGLKPVDYSRDDQRAKWQKKHGDAIGRNVTVQSYPEHEKLEAVREHSQAIGEFFDWLMNDRPGGKVFMCERHPKNEIDNIWVPITGGAEKLIAEYYDIDEKRLEAEKRAILAAQKVANER